MKRRMFLAGGAALVATPASAGILDAITGHFNDVKDRINHDDEFISGDVIATGEFRRDDIGRDPIHWANGRVSVVRNSDGVYLQLESDFQAGPAPDLYIYLADQKVFDEGSFWRSNPNELAKLKSGSGAQYYELESYNRWTHVEVIIWCKRFGAFIGATTLEG